MLTSKTLLGPSLQVHLKNAAADGHLRGRGLTEGNKTPKVSQTEQRPVSPAAKPGASSLNVAVTVRQKAETHSSIYWRGQYSGWGWTRAWCFYCYRDVV